MIEVTCTLRQALGCDILVSVQKKGGSEEASVLCFVFFNHRKKRVFPQLSGSGKVENERGLGTFAEPPPQGKTPRTSVGFSWAL